MSFTLVPLADREQWTSIVGRVRHDVFHTWEYASTAALAEDGEMVLAVASSLNGEVCAPLVIRRIMGSDRYDVSSPYGYSGLITNRFGETSQNLSGLWIKGLADAGFVSLFMRCNSFIGVPAVDVEFFGDVKKWGDQVWIDTRLDESEIYTNLRAGHKSDIEHLVQEGWSVRINHNEDVRRFGQLYRQTMARVEAHPRYYFSDKYFESLFDNVSHTLCTAVSLGGEVGAMSLMINSDNIMHYFLSARGDVNSKYSPVKLSIIEAIHQARLQGIEKLNLGSGIGGANDSLMTFKRGFSKMTSPLETWHVKLDAEAYDTFSADHPVGTFFPQYRA